jgi:hypothetical protein
MRSAACGGNKGVADSEVPLGFTFVDLRRVGEDCFALFMTKDTDDSPTLGPSSGEADEFGPDGRLNLRFFAITRPNGQWELFEYRRLLVHSAVRLKAQN